MKKFLILALALLTLLTGCKTRTADLNFRELEAKYNAQIGIYVRDTNDDSEIAYKADERFAYCSTHKFLSVGALLNVRISTNSISGYFFRRKKFCPTRR